MNKIHELPKFNMAQYIETDVDIAEYLSQVLEEGDVGELAAAALGHIAKACGINSWKYLTKHCVQMFCRVLIRFNVYARLLELSLRYKSRVLNCRFGNNFFFC